MDNSFEDILREIRRPFKCSNCGKERKDKELEIMWTQDKTGFYCSECAVKLGK